MLDVKEILSGKMNLQDTEVMFGMMMHMGELTLSNQNVQNLLKDRSTKFDVIIGEYMFTDLYSS